MKKKRQITIEDLKISWNLQRIRKKFNFSKKKLAQALFISPQQMLKYENAENRIPASKLISISRLFEIDMYEFFKDLPINDTDSILKEHKKLAELYNSIYQNGGIQ